MVTQFYENTKTYLIVYFIGSPGELLKFTEVQTLPKTKWNKMGVGKPHQYIVNVLFFLKNLTRPFNLNDSKVIKM